MKKSIKYLIVGSFFASIGSFAQTTLKQNFQSPPSSAKPRVWWHWMNGNISKEGIQKDLEWMEKVGIGGFQNFDANLFTPVVVPQKLVFMDKNWKEAFKFTTELAHKKGLEMAIAGSPGWSVTGGPWVEPKDGMKKYVYTETKIIGGQSFNGKLPKPSDILSNFQDVTLTEGGILGGYIGEKPKFYQDAFIIAYRIPDTEKTLSELNPKVSSSGGEFSLNKLIDGNLNEATYLPPTEIGKDAWIQYEFDTPQTFKALSLVGASHSSMEQFNGSTENRNLKVSDDGVNFREVTKIYGSIVPQVTVGFEPTTAKYFRVCFKTLPGEVNPIAAMMGGFLEPSKPIGVNVAEFNLFNTSRIDKVEEKAGFKPWKEGTASFSSPNVDVISLDDVIDLNLKMNADGTLNWTVPYGNWNVIRFGYSLTGRQNHPASPEATGLEVDKLDKNAVKKYINTYLDMYKDATGDLMGSKGLQYMILDSYEAGHMNWTKAFHEEFQKRRGYDLKIWLPVLTGRIVKSTEASEKFLWDFRKTIGELIAENHYDVIGEELHKRGMKRYTESHEGGRIYLADGMDVKRHADVPMSAMWTPGSLGGSTTEEEPRSEADIREAASVANIYGQNIVAAESMTSIQNAFSWHPEKLKRTADLEMASGLNRFVIHTSVHQPLEKGPGFSLGPFGQYFTRLETWSGAGAKAWMTYLARSSYMLQQGKNVADILYYYGENNNITSICETKLPEMPAGFEFDFVNSSALLDAIHAENGKIIAKSGNTYQILKLDASAKLMTLPVLKKIKTFVDAGIKVVGARPEESPSMADNDAEFQKITNEIWASPNVMAFEKINIKPDVIIAKADNKILYRHRKTTDQDVYWLDNRSDKATNAEISFRISGKTPELWNAQTGKIEKISYTIKEGRTIIPLKFESWDALFIVFKDKTISSSVNISEKTETVINEVASNWKLNINNKNISTDKLSSWSENADEDIKYFSGTAEYTNGFNCKSINKVAKYVIDLGEVKNIAEVFVNGKNIGTAWKKPFKIDITSALKVGKNTIEVKVTNLWVNRLIGDAQSDVKMKTTFTTMPFYKADAKLLPSGLIGPVKIIELK